jgi:hypothetical protein
MPTTLFHIFRNTPLGRETLLQSIYFCKQTGATPVIYIPDFIKFLMYFENEVVQVDLDASYLTAPDSAHSHASQLVEAAGVQPRFLEPKNFTASTLPDIPTHFDYMCCPRSISDMSSKIGLGYIGPRVRRIVNSARFPVLITSPAYREWHRIAVFFGGSVNAVKAVKLGLRLSRETGMPLEVFTQAEKGGREHYLKILKKRGLEQAMADHVERWHVFDSGSLEENLYEVPHDALVVLGAFGHGLIRDLVFGSKMEKIQSTIANNLLIVGPRYVAPR